VSAELRIVQDLARVVASGPYRVEEIVDRICAEVRGAFGFERAMLVRYDPESQTLFAVVQQGVEWPGEQWLMFDRFPFLVEALECSQAVFVEDARSARAMPSKIIDMFGVHSIVGVPLMVEGQCLGFIVGDRKEGGGRFQLTQNELSFLTTLGAVAAVFIAKAEQYGVLQEALDELKQLDAAKSEFISIASHELRTPIAAVHGLVATLHRRGEELSQEQFADIVSGLYSSTSRLSELTEQLLDLSRIDAGVVPLEPKTFNARDSLVSLVADLAPHAMQIELDVPDSLELTCDPHAFERVVSNVLVNAVLYGRPPVIVRARRDEVTRVVVEDRGGGVDPSFAPRLFERFTRSAKARRTRIDGAGLGLSIAHSFARAIGGDLSYEAAEPTGARFTLVLPG
jgi:signal transduction histidine kinase